MWSGIWSLLDKLVCGHLHLVSGCLLVVVTEQLVKEFGPWLAAQWLITWMAYIQRQQTTSVCLILLSCLKYCCSFIFLCGLSILYPMNTADEPPHQICSYTLLFLLFLRFLYIIDPPLCTSALMRLHAITLTSSDQSCLFDGHMTYDSHVFTSILSISNMPPPAVICQGCNKDLWSRRSKYKSYGALRGCDLGVRDCLQVYCG